MENEAHRPLGGKAYGSIPHLAGSRVGPTDNHVHDGQERILTEKIRDRHDRIIVTEKLDGGCFSVANIDGKLVAIGRGGFPAADSPHEHIRDFASWVRENLFDWRYGGSNYPLQPGQRLVGEWMSMVHSTVYAAIVETILQTPRGWSDGPEIGFVLELNCNQLKDALQLAVERGRELFEEFANSGKTAA